MDKLTLGDDGVVFEAEATVCGGVSLSIVVPNSMEVSYDLTAPEAAALRDWLTGWLRERRTRMTPEIEKALEDYEHWLYLGRFDRGWLAEEQTAARQRLIDAIEAAQVWQPMETAPKDGTPILVCGDRSVISNQIVLYWQSDKGWVDANSCLNVSASCYHLLTHWMYLAPPPN